MSALRNLPHQDQEEKQKMKRYFDKRYFYKRYHVTENEICPGDYVLVKQRKRNKSSSRFDPKPYRITHRQGTMLTAKRPSHTIMGNIQHTKNFLRGEEEEFDIDEEITHDIPPVNIPPVNMPLRKTYPRHDNSRRPEYYHQKQITTVKFKRYVYMWCYIVITVTSRFLVRR